ncbi:MAG TPA: PAS domain S-box protein, partial [Terriglobales bacterium]|nr:PAS domain S-box protein [Terriglobales bacterium]
MSSIPDRYPPSPRLERRWRLYCRLAAATCAGLGGLGLWLGPAGLRLPPAEAWGLVVMALAIVLTERRPRAAHLLAGLLLGGCGVVVGAQVALGSGGWLGRTSPAMVLMALLAAAVALPRRHRLAAVVLALVPTLSGLIALFEAALSASWSPLGPGAHPLGPLTAATLLLLGTAWMAAEPRLRPASFVHEPGSTGWLMRRLVPVVVVFPLLLAWIRSPRNHAHPMATWVGSAIFVLLSFIVFLTLVWKAASALDRLDISRADLQAYAHEISDLYHHAPCGYHSLDADGRIVKINDTELSWLGYKREELVGRVLFPDLLTPASRLAFLRHFPKVQQAGAVQDLELDLIRKDGSLLPAVVSATAITDLQGRFLRTRSTLFDATQRKQAEAALRMSEARNRAILASAADAIVTLEESGAIADFNPAAERMFDMGRALAIEMRGADLLAADSPLRTMPMAALALEAEASPSQHLEFTARRADGSLFPAELTLTRVAGQSPGLYTAFIRDLTERKRAEAELRESEERLRLLLDSTGEGIYALDLEGRCVLCNPAAVRMLGYDRAEDLLGRPIHSLIHHTRADGTPYPASECKSFLAARAGVGIEVDDEVFFRRDGAAVPVEYRSYPVERNGQPVGLVVTFTDVTMRRNLETQIRQSQKMEAVGRLAAGIAHDFNNLLTVINGYSDLLLETTQEADAQDKLRSVRAAGDRAATLTHQLLAFSRQQVLQPRVLDLNSVVRDLEPLLRRSIGEDIELSCELAVDLNPVKADPSQLDQVLMNLVVNARDAMPNGGRIRIETANAVLDEAGVRPHPGLAPGHYALLSVSDTGTGIQDEVQSHIFEPFFTTKPQGKGTGLGLPTVFGIARQSGGTVVVDSVWGRGTAMRVYLPTHESAATAAAAAAAATPRAAATAAAPRAPRPAGGRETILVVEDEDGLRRLLLEILRETGYTVLDAAHPEAALQLSREHTQAIHLLITDVVMPGLHGPE